MTTTTYDNNQANEDWHDPLNWDNGVPTIADDAILDVLSGSAVHFTTTAVCNSLTSVNPVVLFQDGFELYIGDASSSTAAIDLTNIEGGQTLYVEGVVFTITDNSSSILNVFNYVYLQADTTVLATSLPRGIGTQLNIEGTLDLGSFNVNDNYAVINLGIIAATTITGVTPTLKISNLDASSNVLNMSFTYGSVAISGTSDLSASPGGTFTNVIADNSTTRIDALQFTDGGGNSNVLFSSTFTGAGDWSNTGNWSNGIPGQEKQAVIDTASAVYLTAPSLCQSLIFLQSTSLSLSGYNLNIFGGPGSALDLTNCTGGDGTGELFAGGTAVTVPSMSPEVCAIFRFGNSNEIVSISAGIASTAVQLSDDSGLVFVNPTTYNFANSSNTPVPLVGLSGGLGAFIYGTDATVRVATMDFSVLPLTITFTGTNEWALETSEGLIPSGTITGMTVDPDFYGINAIGATDGGGNSSNITFVADSSSSSSTAVTTTFTAVEDGNWHNPANWDNGIPTVSDNAVINTSTAVYLTGNATCASLISSQSTSLSLSTNGLMIGNEFAPQPLVVDFTNLTGGDGTGAISIFSTAADLTFASSYSPELCNFLQSSSTNFNFLTNFPQGVVSGSINFNTCTIDLSSFTFDIKNSFGDPLTLDANYDNYFTGVSPVINCQNLTVSGGYLLSLNFSGTGELNATDQVDLAIGGGYGTITNVDASGSTFEVKAFDFTDGGGNTNFDFNGSSDSSLSTQSNDPSSLSSNSSASSLSTDSTASNSSSSSTSSSSKSLSSLSSVSTPSTLSSASSNTPSSLSSNTPSSNSSSTSSSSSSSTSKSLSSLSSASSASSPSSRTPSSLSSNTPSSNSSSTSSSSSSSKSLSSLSSASSPSSASSNTPSSASSNTPSSNSSSTSSSSSSSKSLSSLSSLSTGSSPSSNTPSSASSNTPSSASTSSSSTSKSLSTATSPTSLSSQSGESNSSATSNTPSSLSSRTPSSGSTVSSSSSLSSLSSASSLSSDSTDSSTSSSTSSSSKSLSTDSTQSADTNSSQSTNSSSTSSSSESTPASASTESMSTSSSTSSSSNILTSSSSSSESLSSVSTMSSLSGVETSSTQSESESSGDPDSPSSVSTWSSESSESSSEFENKVRYVPTGGGFGTRGSRVQYGRNGNFSLFRAGSMVEFKKENRIVFSVTFHYKPGYRREIPGQRIVTHVNLGGTDTMVPVDKVKLIKF